MTGWRWSSWWPILAGLGFGGFVALGLFSGAETGDELASIVAASGLVYLAAAALGTGAAAWPAFLLSVIVITAARLGLAPLDATWILLGIAVLLAGYGLVRGAIREPGGLGLQTIAMIGFGAVAAAALVIEDRVGSYLVAAGLLGHAAWDVYHHRVRKVVPRSMASFCFALDVFLALAIVGVTIR